jgi:hypothetical protein
VKERRDTQDVHAFLNNTRMGRAVFPSFANRSRKQAVLLAGAPTPPAAQTEVLETTFSSENLRFNYAPVTAPLSEERVVRVKVPERPIVSPPPALPAADPEQAQVATA